MGTYRASSSRSIEAASNQVYGILADYAEGHPSILPGEHFLSLEVEQGGFGAGTVINFQMNVLGNVRTFRAAISEPEPGRVLAETDLGDNGGVTTFTVDALESNRCEVTIATEGVTRRSGVLGGIEAALTRLYLQRIYRIELRKLAEACELASSAVN